MRREASNALAALDPTNRMDTSDVAVNHNVQFIVHKLQF